MYNGPSLDAKHPPLGSLCAAITARPRLGAARPRLAAAALCSTHIPTFEIIKI